MKFRRDDVAAPIEIELLSLDGPDASEVSFGGRSPRVGKGGRRRRRAVAGVAALALMGGTALAVRDDGVDGDEDAATPTTEAAVPSTDAVVPVPTVFDRTTTTLAYEAPSAFATDPGWRVYLGGAGTVRSFDPSTGAVERVDASADAYLVTRSADGEPAFLSYGLGGYDTIVPVGDGTGWTLSAGQILRLDLADRSAVERLDAPEGSSFFGPLVLGTDVDGRPIVVLRDLRTYVVALDGTLRQFAEDSVLTTIDRGRYLVSTCDPTGNCVSLLRSGDLTATVDDNVQQVAFSSSGTHAVTFGESGSGPEYRVWDLRSGSVVGGWRFASGAQYVYYGFNSPLPGWSPDGRFFVAASGDTVHVFDAETSETFQIVASELDTQSGVIGVA